MQKLYIDKEGGNYTSWHNSDGTKHKFVSNSDMDIILQKARKQGFDVVILTPEASSHYYGRSNAPKKIELKESKMKQKPTKPVVERLRKKIRSMVESIIREEDYSDVDEDRKKRLTLVLKELDNMMDEIKIGPPYSINYEISTAIKLIEKAIQKIKR